MKLKKGVFLATKKSGEVYYRASITYKNKHISLGSFEAENQAHKAYMEATRIIGSSKLSIMDYKKKHKILSFEKWVCLVNFRDNGMYFKNPIFLHPKYFDYYLEDDEPYKFDVDDLFYYSNHKIMKRGGHLFVADYGMQVNILNRYGIKNFAVPGKDYIFVNGDIKDFRYTNILIINRYMGVTKVLKAGRETYDCKIHINGDYLVGRYKTEKEAAIAYNKAVDVLKEKGITINYQTNYIDDMDGKEYNEKYNQVKISKRLVNFNIVKD